MIKHIVCCDVCEEPLPVESITFLGRTYEIVINEGTKVVNTKPIFPHLCKMCSLMIDNEVLKLKMGMQAQFFKERR